MVSTAIIIGLLNIDHWNASSLPKYYGIFKKEYQMEEVKQLTIDGKVATIYRTAHDYFLVSYHNGDLYLDAGYFTNDAVAEARALEMLNASEITHEMLAGDVEPE